ncbi:NAD-dependent epimerase/dehydratase family protein [Aliarcobacter butzleri]|uniref:NAD-dependent epimerase/dehydratase family protein n=1 Tax=Aliarcobacter butzleri TaxID=28197 RepID=UPI00263E2AEB|nr:NAD-dependent epimerase/dehydratase family protein [Aliarcobacter butzleri]MDN5088814.1 NAD-dependent epimerase/dehydratase family protein [Aliarcobacter butzleri]
MPNNVFNILVTGSKGFIGKNLLKKLEIKNFNILEFNRNDSLKNLEDKIIKSDFIIHLAGEVRPNSTDDDFKNSNMILTKNIIDILYKNDKRIPILMASTIHAKLLKNEYGKTKREAEILIEEYAKYINTNCFIYRLPHVFGEGCKPNYNSVISTWIYNSIHDLEINCFDRTIEMHYVYVQDIVDEFISIIKNQISNEIYIEPKKVYETTLGEVVDLIDEFKHNFIRQDYKINGSEFKEKLYTTYLNYYRNSNV